jgi:beta-N-acetylhexosaminidase
MARFTGGEFIVMGVPGLTLDKETREIIQRVQPAGFILFARNIKEPQQLRALTDELRATVDREPVITIDQEGGRVSRLKEFAVEPPSAKRLTDHGDGSLISRHGTITGKLLRLFGFNLNLAPVLDVLVDEKRENSLKDRTYGRTPQEVIRNASAFVDAMSAEGILTCGKHYPGYSMANVDPHNDLPTVQRTLEELLALEWVAFKEMLPKLDLVMVGHVSYPEVDPSGLPATLSRTMVHKTLRENWHFKGCTVTDDMDMGAIKTRYGGAEAAASALKAGNDLMLVCHAITSVPEIAAAIAKAPQEILEESFSRIEAMRKRFQPPAAYSAAALNELDQGNTELRAKTGLSTAATGPVPAT